MIYICINFKIYMYYMYIQRVYILQMKYVYVIIIIENKSKEIDNII